MVRCASKETRYGFDNVTYKGKQYSGVIIFTDAWDSDGSPADNSSEIDFDNYEKDLPEWDTDEREELEDFIEQIVKRDIKKGWV